MGSPFENCSGWGLDAFDLEILARFVKLRAI